MARYYIQVGIHATNIDEYLLYTKCHINLWVKMVNKTKQNKTNKQKTDRLLTFMEFKTNRNLPGK